MKRFYQFVQDYFSLSFNEAKGFFSLLVVCLLAICLYVIPSFIHPADQQPLTHDESISLDSLANTLQENLKPHVARKLFRFNPNNISADSLLLLGLSSRLASRLHYYRQQGGKFKIKSDLKKIYGLPITWYDSVYAFIDLPEKSLKIHESSDLNKVTARQISRRTDISFQMASRICNYRELLGGYISFDQLQEVYEITADEIHIVRKHFRLNEKFLPRQIHINKASVKKLKKHPYISDRLAEDIVRYRDINHVIESKMVLANFKSVDKRNFEKLIFYLDFQQ